MRRPAVGQDHRRLTSKAALARLSFACGRPSGVKPLTVTAVWLVPCFRIQLAHLLAHRIAPRRLPRQLRFWKPTKLKLVARRDLATAQLELHAGHEATYDLLYLKPSNRELGAVVLKPHPARSYRKRRSERLTEVHRLASSKCPNTVSWISQSSLLQGLLASAR